LAGRVVDAEEIARPFRDEVRAQVRERPPIRLRGILSSERRASAVYARYTERGCQDVGIAFELVEPKRLEVEQALLDADEDPSVHGVIVYYPIWGGERDRTIQNEIAIEKDVEGLSAHWVSRLYGDVRHADHDPSKKAILPCTPLAIVKTLEVLGIYRAGAPVGTQASDRVISIFNRSEVVGRPLAAMLAHDGARVHSFDIEDVLLYERQDVREETVSRAAALAESDVVITGVPSHDFPPIRAAELKAGAVAINFSTAKNMDDDVIDRASLFVPRVGPITVAMLLRNTLRLYDNYHRG
jgi:methylenetetrahydrofolate dehydrogenase (NADP+)/methenyltetrahydrofolate cyclohydrolase